MESPSHPSRMAIDSLLNPPTAAAEADRPTPQKLHHYASAHSPLTPQDSPLYPPSPHQQHYYSFSDDHRHHQTQQQVHHHHHHHYHPYSHHGSSQKIATPTHHQDHHYSHHSQHHHHPFMPYHRPRSTDSSPESYARDRDRYSSVSSTSSTNGAAHSSSNSASGDQRRPPRPKYEEEEMYFIWYHRVDLCQEWKEVRESFNRQFPNRQRSGFQGIQCKFYRFIKEKKCPTLREQRRMRDGEFLRQESTTSSRGDFGSGAPQFGVVEWMGVWYPWMREDREEVMRRRLSR
ncbi:hypothetical protein BJY01DRAFT_64092 [Aspergillus pseudoustus]|uniref:Myb-like domain-containing protein n=1 Tax=Aspergillus pseudoustus TaxID=1810923 RepID=A0ABR4KN00_9EURO